MHQMYPWNSFAFSGVSGPKRMTKTLWIVLFSREPAVSSEALVFSYVRREKSRHEKKSENNFFGLHTPQMDRFHGRQTKKRLWGHRQLEPTRRHPFLYTLFSSRFTLIINNSTRRGPYCEACVDSSALVFSLSSHRHSFIGLVLSSRFVDE